MDYVSSPFSDLPEARETVRELNENMEVQTNDGDIDMIPTSIDEIKKIPGGLPHSKMDDFQSETIMNMCLIQKVSVLLQQLADIEASENE